MADMAEMTGTASMAGMFEYHVLTIGQFSRNCFWGEDDGRAYRGAVCTSTLVKGAKNIVADPSLPPEEMAAVLYNRSGLRPEAIDAVFVTHAHGDHYVGIECFPNAKWYMSATDLEAMLASADGRERELAGRMIPASPGFVEGVGLLAAPGHTLGTAAMLFDSADGRVAVCGDAAMTRDFFRARKGYYNSADFALSAQSIDRLAEAADIVVPGHGNYFINRRQGAGI
ncbi:MAG: MBL fold metallo-hydrolase [Clostridiales bacterium]|jgi:glyoxylase-like metal-dependent hydrolase (beta-lactamase superfamily II)|nr:MBL fold metallo-hydrolase [Clostridiales bacterium]